MNVGAFSVPAVVPTTEKTAPSAESASFSVPVAETASIFRTCFRRKAHSPYVKIAFVTSKPHPKLPLSQRRVMQKTSINRTDEVRRYLESYLLLGKMLSGNRYAREYLGAPPDGEDAAADDPFIQAKMIGIRHFIMQLPDCREKMLLYYRYLYGRSVEACAEILGVSRRTAFRIAADALIFAADNFTGQ